MDREEILASVQKDKSGRGKEFEHQTAFRSGVLCMLITIIVGTTLFLIEYFVKGNINWGFLTIAYSGICADQVFIGIKTNKALKIIMGTLAGFVALIALLMFFNGMVTV